jgi:NO-binding membrane sensor protein with MHYT domain
MAAAVFGLLSLLALSVSGQVTHPLYLVVFALIVGLGAAVLGISAARRARREDTARPRGSVAAIVMGVLAVILGLLAVLVVVYSSQFNQYERCLKNASSSTAEQVCAHNLLHAVQSQERGG